MATIVLSFLSLATLYNTLSAIANWSKTIESSDDKKFALRFVRRWLTINIAALLSFIVAIILVWINWQTAIIFASWPLLFLLIAALKSKFKSKS